MDNTLCTPVLSLLHVRKMKELVILSLTLGHSVWMQNEIGSYAYKAGPYGSIDTLIKVVCGLIEGDARIQPV
jgi:hypothetical protein